MRRGRFFKINARHHVDFEDGAATDGCIRYCVAAGASKSISMEPHATLKLAFRPVAGNSYAFSGARFPCGRRLIYRTMLDSEETLVQRAKAGDRAAFEDLVRRVSRL